MCNNTHFPIINFLLNFILFRHRLILENNPKSVEFQMRILERSGLGEETSLPHAIHYIPPIPTIEAARDEAELVIFSAMDTLFQKTKLKPKDIDILIVNCSLFFPTPSFIFYDYKQVQTQKQH